MISYFADRVSDGMAMNCEISDPVFVFLKSASCIVGYTQTTLIGLIFIY